MNQGARDANAESAQARSSNRQDEIIAELRRMNYLLTRIANNTSKDGVFITDTTPTDTAA